MSDDEGDSTPGYKVSGKVDIKGMACGLRRPHGDAALEIGAESASDFSVPAIF